MGEVRVHVYISDSIDHARWLREELFGMELLRAVLAVLSPWPRPDWIKRRQETELNNKTTTHFSRTQALGTGASLQYLEVRVGGAGGGDRGVVVAEETLLSAHHRRVSLAENPLGRRWGPAGSLRGLLE